MKISEIKSILNAELICGEEFIENEVHTACGSDMMSDVLAYVKEQAVLLSGLVNPQVVRTAEMMDMKCIVFVRGKEPDEDMIELAVEIPALSVRAKSKLSSNASLYIGGTFSIEYPFSR